MARKIKPDVPSWKLVKTLLTSALLAEVRTVELYGEPVSVSALWDSKRAQRMAEDLLKKGIQP